MTYTTHEAQMERYSQGDTAPEIATTDTTTIDDEITALMKEIVERQKQLADAYADLERLTERNLPVIHAALSGTK